MHITDAAALLKRLGDPTRLTMVKLLESHEYCVCEFVDMFDMSQPAISQHLRKLKEIGLVNEERRGQWIYYSLNKTHHTYPFIERILQQLDIEDHQTQQAAKGFRIHCE